MNCKKKYNCNFINKKFHFFDIIFYTFIFYRVFNGKTYDVEPEDTIKTSDCKEIKKYLKGKQYADKIIDQCTENDEGHVTTL